MKQKWTDEEIDFLKNNFQEKTCEQIGAELSRTTKSVQHKFNQLKLKHRQAQVGEIINGWEIIDITIVNCGNQNIRMAKIKSTLDDKTIKEDRLTKLTNRQIGWPDRRRPDTVLRNTTHGMSRTRLFRIWYGMKNRCLNQKQLSYKRYGGRGIKICDDWLNSFVNFHDWASKNGYEEHLTLDRINNNGNYEPDNCRWVLWQEQCSNKENSSKKILTAFGETKSIYSWTRDDRCKVNIHTLFYRIGAGWNHEKAITKESERKIRQKLREWLVINHPEIYEKYLILS